MVVAARDDGEGAPPPHGIRQDETMPLNARFTLFPRGWKQRYLVSPA